jgi:hypothetical protein
VTAYRKILSLNGILLIALIIIALAMGITLFCVPPFLGTDPSQGFLVLRSMNAGGPFNCVSAVNQGDISQSHNDFLAWWSPGQYMVPWLAEKASGLNLGKSIALVVFAANVSGLAGLYFFFRKTGFSTTVVLLSLLFIVCQRQFVIPGVYYNGGEIMLFSFYGWFLYGCLTFSKTGIRQVLFIIAAGFFGFFLKSSFLWMYAAGLLFMVLHTWRQHNIWTDVKNKVLCMALPAALVVGTIYSTYISRGESPGTVAAGLKLSLLAFCYPTAMPVLAGFSIDDMLHGIADRVDPQRLPETYTAPILAAGALLSVLLVWAILRTSKNRNYNLLLLCFFGVSVIFFVVSYLRQMDISMETRHYRVISILIVPGFITLIGRAGRPLRYIAAGLCLLIAASSFMFLYNGTFNNNRASKALTGITQPNIDQRSLNQLIRLDGTKTKLIFVLTGDDIGLELTHHRIVPLQPIPDDLKIDMGDYRYYGHSDPLYVVLPKEYAGPREAIIKSAFPGYHIFNKSVLSPNYYLLVGQ